MLPSLLQSAPSRGLWSLAIGLWCLAANAAWAAEMDAPPSCEPPRAKPTPAARTDLDPRPNILFIMSDDHAAQAVGAYGSKLLPTPNIDRLAAEGMRFDRAFVTNSICTPSRAVILTGKHSHITGVTGFLPFDYAHDTFPELLQRAGYHTVVVGKWHLYVTPRGFDYFSVLPGQGSYFDPELIEPAASNAPANDVAAAAEPPTRTVTERGYVSDVIADRAIDYLEHLRPKDRPFALLLHHKAPHDTWEYHARYASLLADRDVPAPATLFDDYATRSAALRLTTQKIGMLHTEYPRATSHLVGAARKHAQYQQYIKRYLRCVAGVDDNVGRVLDYLDAAGLTQNTLVVYTSDQGFFLGEHGLYDKRFMYEESLRVPLLMRWPSVVAAGSTCDELVLNLDLAPTLLDAARVAAPADMQGRSLAPLVRGERVADWRNAFYYRYYFSHFETEPHYGVRTVRYKLIHFPRIDAWELFDLERDPHELVNVYSDTAYADRATKLKKTLEDERLQARDPEPRRNE